jgi:hypothetical protein
MKECCEAATNIPGPEDGERILCAFCKRIHIYLDRWGLRGWYPSGIDQIREVLKKFLS